MSFMSSAYLAILLVSLGREPETKFFAKGGKSPSYINTIAYKVDIVKIFLIRILSSTFVLVFC